MTQQLEIYKSKPKSRKEKPYELKTVKNVCIKENRVKAIHKIKHNIWYNRARRRFRKAEYFSERA